MNRPTTLTATFAKTVRQPGRYGDGRGGHGLSLLVQPTRIAGRWSKTWSQRLRIDGKQRSIGLGSYPTVTLAEARKRALANRQAVAEGRDPRQLRIPTFQQATEKVIEIHAGKWKPGGRTEEHWRASLHTYAYPHLGKKRVNEITSADVMRCLRPIWHTKPEMARKAKRRISAVMKWAIAQAYRSDDPADSRIPAALGSNHGGGSHFKALPHRLLADAYAQVVGSGSSFWSTRAALQFLILTAARSGEVRGARWTEIDGDTWTIPADRTKTGKPHRVPLSEAAVAVLEDARKRTTGRGLVFPAKNTRKQSNMTMGSLLKRLGIPCTPHGMRSSFRSWAAESGGVERQLAEMSLSHAVPGVEGVYMRSDRLEERRAVMADWAAYTT